MTALYYRFTSEIEYDHFEKAEPASGVLGSFSCTLADGVLEAIPSVEFRDRQAARDALEPQLRDWEESAYLSDRAFRIRFVYDRSSVEEVDPKPGVINLFGEASASGGGAATLTITRRDNLEYPSFDTGFRSSPLVQRLAVRLRRTRDGGETWPAFANFVLTQLEVEFGGASDRRRNASKVLAVDLVVLRRLGEITARPDPEIGRKAAKNPATITGPERAWMEAVVVRLIRRVGEHAASGPLAAITMADFPPLP